MSQRTAALYRHDPRELHTAAIGTRADGAYHRLLRELWAAGEDFIVDEHDFVIDADATPRGTPRARARSIPSPSGGRTQRHLQRRKR